MRRRAQQSDSVITKIKDQIEKILFKLNNNILLHTNTIKSYDVEKILKRGFVLVEQNSKFVTRASKFIKNKETRLKFYDGTVDIHK
jgi:exonuclease VII large subunit